MNQNTLQIPSAVMPAIKAFFAFSLFNTIIVGLHGVFLAVTILFAYYFCLAVQKALLRI